jgi:hypothetical protein
MKPTPPHVDLDQHRRVHARIAKSLAMHTGRMPWAGFGAGALDCVPVGVLLLALALLPATIAVVGPLPELGEVALHQEQHAGP